MSNVLNVAGYPIDLDGGRTLAPGEQAEKVNTDNPHNKALVANGHLTVVGGKMPSRPTSEAVKKAAQTGEDDR